MTRQNAIYNITLPLSRNIDLIRKPKNQPKTYVSSILQIAPVYLNETDV